MNKNLFPYEVQLRSNGTQELYHFSNGWEASVVRNEYSYGGKEGLWEVAAVSPQGEIKHRSVRGWLTREQVLDKLLSIARKRSQR